MRIAQQAGHGTEYAQPTGGTPTQRARNTALHVVSVPCEREPDLPRVLGRHRTTSLRRDAEHVPRHEQR